MGKLFSLRTVPDFYFQTPVIYPRGARGPCDSANQSKETKGYPYRNVGEPVFRLCKPSAVLRGNKSTANKLSLVIHNALADL